MSSAGIDHAVLNVFRLFGKMGGQQLATTSSSGIDAETIRTQGVLGAPDINAWASRDDKQVCVLLWHYHDDNIQGPAAQVALTVDGIPAGTVRVVRYLVDTDHCNPYELWKNMGSPESPSAAQLTELRTAGKLVTAVPDETVRCEGGTLAFDIPLARQAVMLLVLIPE